MNLRRTNLLFIESDVRRETPRDVLRSKRVLNIAHRGGAAEGPEQTLATFRNAIRQGADVLELDVHRTSDGTVVVCHDATVNRTTNGQGRIRDMTLAQIQKLDAAYRYSIDGGKTFPHRNQGMRIPTLRKVLRAFPHIPFVIEIKQTKPPIFKKVLAIVAAARASDRVIMSSAHDQILAEVRRAKPDMLTGFTSSELMAFTLLTTRTEKTYRPPGDYLQILATLVTPKLIARAKRLKLRLHAWTVNDVKEMQRLKAIGVAGITTDYPSRLSKLLTKPKFISKGSSNHHPHMNLGLRNIRLPQTRATGLQHGHFAYTRLSNL